MATYYVDGVSGSDSSGNGSSGNPWKTLNKGYTSMSAHDTLRVRTATYREQLAITKTGVTIENDTGHTPTIDGNYSAALFGAAGYTNANGAQIGAHELPSPTAGNKNRGNWVVAGVFTALVTMGTGSNITLRGFHIRNVCGRALVFGGTNNTAENIRIDFTYGGAVQMGGVDCVMDGCVITRSSMKYFDPTRAGSGGQKVQATAIVKSLRGKVRNCTICYNYGEGLACDQEARELELSYNDLHTNNHWSLGINESHGHRIFGNRLYWCANLADEMERSDKVADLFTLSSERDQAPYDATDNFIWNNLFVGGDNCLLVAGGTSGRRIRLVNSYFGYNTFVGRPETGTVVYIGVIGGQPHNKFLFENNLIWKHPNGNNIATLQNGMQAATSTFRNSVSNGVLPGMMSGADSVVVGASAALMVNPTANFTGTLDRESTALPDVSTTFNPANYNLSPDSPAIGRASNRSASAGVTPPVVNIDRYKASRTDLNPSAGRYYDVGSAEFGGAVTNSVTAAFNRNPAATTLVQGTSVTFTNSSIVTGTAVITGQTWRVRKAGTLVHTATTANLTYAFATAGSYTVELEVAATGGLSDTETVAYTITEGGGGVVVTAAFSANPPQTTVAQGTAVTFTGQSTVQNGTLASQAWAILTLPGLATVASGSGGTYNYTFNTAGNFRVRLTATATTGETDTETVDMTVTSVTTPTVTASFTVSDADRVVTAGASVTFTSTSTVSNTTITGVLWSVQRQGDTGGHAYTTTPMSHTFTQPGLYTVTLLVQTAAGVTDSETALITVQSEATTGDDFMVVPVAFALSTSTGTQTVTAAALGTKIPKGVHLRMAGATSSGTAANGALWSEGAASDTAQWVHVRFSANGADTTAARRRYATDAIAMSIDAAGAVTGRAAFGRFVAGGMELSISDAFPSAYLAEAIFYAGDACEFWAGSVPVGNLNTDTAVDTGIDQAAVYCLSTWAAAEDSVGYDADFSRGWAVPGEEDEVTQYHFRNEDQDGKATATLFGRWQPRIASSNDGPDNSYCTIEARDFHVGGFNLRPVAGSMAGRVASLFAFATGGYRVALQAAALSTGATSVHPLEFEAQTVMAITGTFTGESFTSLTGTQPEASGWYTQSIHGPSAVAMNIAAQNGAATSSTRSYRTSTFQAVGPGGATLWNGAGALDAAGLTFTWSSAPAAAYRLLLLAVERGQDQGSHEGPIAGFLVDIDANTQAGRAVVWFDSSISNGNGAEITAWLWDFGDGATSAEANPHHVYEQPGEYTVSLTVTTSAGSNTKTVAALVVVTMDEETVDLVGLSEPLSSGGATENAIDEDGNHYHAIRFDNWAHFRAMSSGEALLFTTMQPDPEYVLVAYDTDNHRFIVKEPDGTLRYVVTTT